MNKFIQYRREFHKYPELGWHEIRTSARIGEILTEMGYQVLMGLDVINASIITKPSQVSEEERENNKKRAIEQGAKPEWVEKTQGYPGVIAIYDTGKEGPVTAFRLDIDCLPGDEPKEAGFRPYDEDYVSCNDGLVHSCGHDAHAAMGLGIAHELITQKREDLCGKIKIIFQPAEERFFGALSIVAKGHLDDVKYTIVPHIALSAENKPLPSNTMCCGCKDFLSNRRLDVYFHGKGAHPCGASQEGKNALLAACTAALNIHAIAPHEAGLMRVNVGEICGGACANVIAPEAKMVVEYRGVKPEISAYAGKRIMDIIEGASRAYDMTFTYDDYGETPAAQSDNAMMEIIERAGKKVPWFKKIYFEGNVGGSDDGSAMMMKTQENGGIATYVGIGTDTTKTLHNPKFDIDEECIPAAIELFMNAIEEIHKIK